jgi:tetratricopeptide (TPR) repeat protein
VKAEWQRLRAGVRKASREKAMKNGSKRALAGALGLALALGVAPSAMAQKPKKGEAAAPATPPLSKEFRTAAMPAQAAVTAKAWPDALVKLDAADLVAKTPYEKFVAAQLRYLAARGAGNAAMESKAADAMAASGGAPADLAGPLALQIGSNAYAAGNFPRALQMLTEADRLGAKDDQLPVLIADTHFRLKNVPAGMAALEKGIAAKKAAGQPVPDGWYKRARAAAYNGKMDAETSKWSRALIAAYPTQSNWRDGLVVFRDSATRTPAINLDLFRLMRATKALDGERDYMEHASLSFDSGLPGEAKSVVDEGFALAKVPTGSRALAEVRTMALSKITADRASLPASERASATSARTALATADAFYAYGDDAKAVTLYQSAIAKGGIDLDAANMRLGMSLLRSGQRDAARAAFQKVTATGSRGELAQFWLLHLEQGARPAA